MDAISPEQLRATIRFRGDYQNVRKFPNTELDKEMQVAFAKFYQLVADEHQGWWDTEGTITTVAGQTYLALPPGCWRVQGVDILDGSDYRALSQVGLEHRNRHGATQTKPETFRTSARGLELGPTPDAAYTLRVMYTPAAPQLMISQPREWYNGWHEYILESVLAVFDRREGKGVKDRLDAIDNIARAVKAGAASRRQSEPEYLDLREGHGGGPWYEGDY